MELERWEIDSAHSGIHFAVRHLVISKVRGKFARWSGSIEIDPARPERVKVEVAIDATSIDTGVTDRDTHLASPDFLDVARYPEITFRAERAESRGDGRLSLQGELSIRGVTRPVVLDVEAGGQTKDPWGNTRSGFTAKTSIHRKDFGLTWNQVLEAGGLMVGEQIDIELEVEAVKQATAPTA